MYIHRVPVQSIHYHINDHTFELLAVEGGTFMMGSEESKREKPIHQVKLSSFLLGKYPVTQVLWEQVMGTKPSRFQGLHRPVEQVSWYEATEFCNGLSEQLGKEQVYKGSGDDIEIDYSASGFRLPTESEWEYAARGGKHQEGYVYSGSDKPHLVGWYNENSHDETQVVGLKAPNALGLYDMSGNVYEWCNDWYGSYPADSKENPKGATTGTSRVFRGGSWYYDSLFIRVAFRNPFLPEYGSNFVGFRLCFPQF